MQAAPSQDWNIFKQICAEPWNGLKRVYPRDDQRYYAALVDKMLGGGNPAKIGSIAYHCLQGGEGPQRVSMSGKSSLCLRCAKVYVANGVSHVSRMRHAGVIDRPIVLTMPAMVRKTFDQQSQALLSPFMRCGVQCLDDGFSRVRGRTRKGGSIVVMQTHGRHGQYTPQLHCMATSGGWEQQAR